MAETLALTAAPALDAPQPETRVSLIVENMTCGSCLAKVERALRQVDGVSSVRANLSARRVSVGLTGGGATSRQLVDALAAAGYQAAGIAQAPPDAAARRERELLKRIGVAGFAAANIMLLSVSVWAGMTSDMSRASAGAFHWLSALVALPAVAYAGQPFFQSAAAAIRARRLNMDVPVSVAICLATAMSLFQTARGGEQVYFDAAVTLLFFLLIGRFLDQRVRVKAAGAAQNLLALKAAWANVLQPDGSLVETPGRELAAGQRILVAAGDRIAADGVIRKGRSSIDESLISGESAPNPHGAGDAVYCGTLNLTGPLEIEVTAASGNTLLDEIGRLMDAAEQGKGRFVRLADRAARIYAPLVHGLGLATFLGWLAAGATWEAALTAAIAVLIITCPCALALAVPVVQVAAAGRLFAKGMILKAADGLERLAEVDTIVLDKTGTLTTGLPELEHPELIEPAALRAAASLAAASRHPYARGLVRAAAQALGPVTVAMGAEEHSGAGMSLTRGAITERLGSAEFAGAGHPVAGHGLWFTDGKGHTTGFAFSEKLRPGAAETAGQLTRAGYHVELLSGDRPERVARIAAEAGIAEFRGGRNPVAKLARLAELKAQGRRVLMVGDGLNDAPALAAGHASLSPAAAADISQNAADVIWQGASLEPLAELLGVARASRGMALENFAIALAYNAVSVPLAMLGHVTPLVAAIAMSTSSIAVTLNALRLRSRRCALKAAAR